MILSDDFCLDFIILRKTEAAETFGRLRFILDKKSKYAII